LAKGTYTLCLYRSPAKLNLN